MAFAPFLVIVLFGAPLLLFSYAEAGEVGVSWGRVANDLPDPASVVELLQETGITMVRIYDADPEVLTALADTGIKVMVMMPNDELPSAAASRSYALNWVQCNVSSYYPATQITGVAIGNEVFEETQRPELTRSLVKAMTNVHAALQSQGLADAVKVSTPIAFSALKDTFPPSGSRFRDDVAETVMKPMLRFLRRTGSYLSMNPYPFFAYANDPKNIPLDYALGNAKQGVRDDHSGLVYYSLLDAMMDATYYAVENLTAQLNTMEFAESAANQPSPRTHWPESGWPSRGQLKRGKHAMLDAAGDAFQPATVANAQAYNNYLINRVLSGKTGTPHRPDADMNIYIFALFNENQKGQGPDDAEQYFGLFCPDMTKAYEFDFRGGDDSAVHNNP